jgi:hypothetical protein
MYQLMNGSYSFAALLESINLTLNFYYKNNFFSLPLLFLYNDFLSISIYIFSKHLYYSWAENGNSSNNKELVNTCNIISAISLHLPKCLEFITFHHHFTTPSTVIGPELLWNELHIYWNTNIWLFLLCVGLKS